MYFAISRPHLSIHSLSPASFFILVISLLTTFTTKHCDLRQTNQTRGRALLRDITTSGRSLANER